MKRFVEKLIQIFTPKAEPAKTEGEAPVSPPPAVEEEDVTLADKFYTESAAFAQAKFDEQVNHNYRFILSECEQRKEIGAMECQFQIGSTEDWPVDIQLAVANRLRKDGFEVKTFYYSCAIQLVSWEREGERWS